MEADRNAVSESYDKVAEEYVRRIFHELDGKPLDRQLLGRLIAETAAGGLICDLGCGPGHVAHYLKSRGANVVGADLSRNMVESARRLNPGIEFFRTDMFALAVEDESWDAIVAFYSIVNIPQSRLADVFREMRRALKIGGKLLLSFHVGTDTVHLDEWWGCPVSIDFFFFSPAEVIEALALAGFVVEEVIQRDPYPDVEHQSKRAYLFCRRI